MFDRVRDQLAKCIALEGGFKRSIMLLYDYSINFNCMTIDFNDDFNTHEGLPCC